MPTINFPKMIADIITSPHDQHATMICYATTGAGKDYTCMSIGWCVAEEVAKIKGGKPSDYFTVENIAVITQEEVVRVLKERMDVPWSVVGFSDIGLAWNSRDFMGTMNKAMNDIVQIFRTKNLFLYMTLPDPSLLDIVPRGLSKFKLEIEKSYFDQGYTQCKIFETVKKPRYQSDPLHQYLHDLDGNKIVKHIVYRPPFELANEYTKRRRAIEAISTAKSVDTIEDLINFDPEAKEKAKELNQVRKETEKEERKRLLREKRQMELDERKKEREAKDIEKQKYREEQRLKKETQKSNWQNNRILKDQDRLMRDLKIIELHRANKTWDDIGVEAHCNHDVISRVLKAAKLI